MLKHQMKKKNVVIILIIVLALVAVTVTCMVHNNFDLSQMFGFGNSVVNTNNNTTATPKLTDNGQSIKGQATPESTQQILDDLKKKEVYVTDSIGSCINFSGKTGDNAAWKVQNLPDNSVIEQVELFYNNQLIGTTTPIYPNQHVDSIQINKSLQSGNYDAVAYINYYNSDTKDLMGKTAYKIKIQVD